MTQICNDCEIEKPLKDFSKDKSRRIGVCRICKICASIWNKIYTTENCEKIKRYRKKYIIKNSVKIKANRKKYLKENSIKVKAREKKYLMENKEKIKNDRIKNKDKIKAYRIKNKDKAKEQHRIYMCQAYKTDSKFKLNSLMSNAIRGSLKNGKNGRQWETLVGYSVDDLKKHFEKLFTIGMSWDKFLKGEIHIDHKIPINAHNFTEPEHQDFKKCWALKNLQPMWALENMMKSDKLKKPFQPSLMI